MDLTSTEITKEIWISFSRFIRIGSVLPQKCSATWFFFLDEAYAILNDPLSLSLFLSVRVCGSFKR